MNVSWPVLKSFVDRRIIPIQWVDIGDGYILKVADNFFELDCTIAKDSGSEQTEFEASYKNSTLPVSIAMNVLMQPAFANKSIMVNGVKKNLYARNTGKRFEVVTGTNILEYIVPYAWVKMIGLECIGGELGDYADLKVYDTAAGTYSGVPNLVLNQFGFALNMAKDYYERTSPFDSDVYGGMTLKLNYTSMSYKNIGINYMMNEVKS